MKLSCCCDPLSAALRSSSSLVGEWADESSNFQLGYPTSPLFHVLSTLSLSNTHPIQGGEL